MFQTKVGTVLRVLTETGVEVQIVGQNGEGEGKISDQQQFYPAILQKVIIEFFINTFCIPLL